MRCRLQFLLFSAILFVQGVAPSARAQATAGVRLPRPDLEISGGYSSLLANFKTSGTRFNLIGGSYSLDYYKNNWLGLVGDVGVYHQGNIAASGFGLTLSTFQFGPHIRIQHHTRLTPFAELLLGVGHAGGSLYTRSLGTGLSPLGVNNGFLLTLGGGADWKLTPRIGIRLVQVEYLRSQFLNGSTNRQDNLRLSIGIVFHFGEDGKNCYPKQHC
jgi:hypothetical protein